MHESEREIQDRIQHTRERMGETIERIGDRVNPDRVQRELKARAREQVDDFKQNVKLKARSKMRDVEHGMNETGRGIWDTIKHNPLPAGMVGVGLAWLVTNGASDRASRSPSRGYGYGRYGYRGMGDDFYARQPEAAGGYAAGYVGADVDGPAEPFTAGSSGIERGFDGESSGIKERGREAAHRVREKGEHAMESARDKGEHAIDSAREKGEHAMESARAKGSELAHRAEEGMHEVRDRARHWADEAQDRAWRTERRVEDSVREHPLAAGAVAAALGFAAGMMIPETQKEREMMGHARERVMDRAQETARRAGQKAKDVARETAGDSAKKAVDEMMGGGNRGAKRESVAEPGR